MTLVSESKSEDYAPDFLLQMDIEAGKFPL